MVPVGTLSCRTGCQLLSVTDLQLSPLEHLLPGQLEINRHVIPVSLGRDVRSDQSLALTRTLPAAALTHSVEQSRDSSSGSALVRNMMNATTSGGILRDGDVKCHVWQERRRRSAAESERQQLLPGSVGVSCVDPDHLQCSLYTDSPPQLLNCDTDKWR